MKKYAKIITAILIISMLSLALFACINPDSDKEGKMLFSTATTPKNMSSTFPNFRPATRRAD